jgi:outer membrane protein TolC
VKTSTKVRFLFPLTAGLWLISAGVLAAQSAAPSPAPVSPAPVSPAPVSPAPLPVVTLEEVVAAARASAPGLKLAQVTRDSARSQLVQVQATNGLSLGGKGDYFHQGSVPGTTTASSSGSGGGTSLAGENLGAGLTLSGPATSVGLSASHAIGETAPQEQLSSVSLSASQTVFDGYPGGRAAAAVQQAQDAFGIAQVAYDGSVKSVVYQARQSYYTLLGDQNTVGLRQATVAQAQSNLAYYQGLLNAGRATSLEVLQVQVTLTQAQLDLTSARNTVAVDRKKLSLAVGWPLDRDYAVADAPAPELPTTDQKAALDTAFQNRSELRTLEMNIHSAGVALALQRTQALPVVSVNGSLNLGQEWTSNVSTGSFTAGVSVALPIVDGGLRGAQTDQAADQVSAFTLQQDQQKQSITIDVQNALFGVRDAGDRLDLAGQNVRQAQGQYDLEKAKFAVGLETTLDVLTAFSALTSAQVGQEQARSAYMLAILNLNNVMGL